jgi:hypothetical protein
MKAIKTFRDLLDFPSAIPLGNIKEKRAAAALLLAGVWML